MSEIEPRGTMPSFRLQKESGEFRATPDNTLLVKYVGQTAVNGEVMENSTFDFIRFENEENEDDGAPPEYVFSVHPMYETLKEIIERREFPILQNQHRVSPDIIEGYQEAAIREQAREMTDNLGKWLSDNG